MTKYPIKHTMEFGEETCPDCNGPDILAGHPGTCQRCNGKGTIPLSVTFDLIKDCPECDRRDPYFRDAIKVVRLNGGKISISYLQRRFQIGYNRAYRLAEAIENFTPCSCSNNGLPAGKAHRYWTPEEAAEHIKKETGIDWGWPEDTAVWYYTPSKWEAAPLGEVVISRPKILRFHLQPVPPADYRP